MLYEQQIRLAEGVYLEDEEGLCYVGPAVLKDWPKDGTTSHEVREKHKWVMKTIAPAEGTGTITCDDYGFVHGEKGVLARLKVIQHH